jgi:hypothetical protein
MSRIHHQAVLQKFIYRLSGDLTDETRKRLHLLITIYTRLYA